MTILMAAVVSVSATRKARARSATIKANAPAGFSARVEQDEALKTPVITLRYDDARDAKRSLGARIAPSYGANLFSLTVGEHELLFGGDNPSVLGKSGGGTPVLFPTPNRVRDARFSFDGRDFAFPANNNKNFLHGLVRTKSFYFDQPRATASAAEVRTFLEWDERQEDFALFPIRHRVEIKFTLTRAAVKIAYQVNNTDKVRLPFGFGLHPWFRVPGRKDDVFIQVPASHHMEAVDLLPTGTLVPLAGLPLDLRKPVPLAGLALDDVYFGVKPAAAPKIEWRDLGIALSLGGSKDFGHMVVYTPDRPVFCLENQTSSTDAHNLYGAGKTRASGLLIVAPGGKRAGRLEWKVKLSR